MQISQTVHWRDLVGSWVSSVTFGSCRLDSYATLVGFNFRLRQKEWALLCLFREWSTPSKVWHSFVRKDRSSAMRYACSPTPSPLEIEIWSAKWQNTWSCRRKCKQQSKHHKNQWSSCKCKVTSSWCNAYSTYAHEIWCTTHVFNNHVPWHGGRVAHAKSIPEAWWDHHWGWQSQEQRTMLHHQLLSNPVLSSN